MRKMGEISRSRRPSDALKTGKARLAAAIGRPSTGKRALRSTSQTVPLSSIRDAAPKCKRFAEIFCGNRKRKRAEANADAERGVGRSRLTARARPGRSGRRRERAGTPIKLRGKFFDFFSLFGGNRDAGRPRST